MEAIQGCLLIGPTATLHPTAEQLLLNFLSQMNSPAAIRKPLTSWL
jgi:hypothetical protein